MSGLSAQQGELALSIDYTGQHGGQLAMAFAAGCIACFTFCAMVGKFIWDKLTAANSTATAAKDDVIAELKKTIEKNEERCADATGTLSARVQQLETLLLVHGSGAMRQDLQRVISEQRVEQRKEE